MLLITARAFIGFVGSGESIIEATASEVEWGHDVEATYPNCSP